MVGSESFCTINIFILFALTTWNRPLFNFFLNVTKSKVTATKSKVSASGNRSFPLPDGVSCCALPKSWWGATSLAHRELMMILLTMILVTIMILVMIPVMKFFNSDDYVNIPASADDDDVTWRAWAVCRSVPEPW